MYRQSAHISHPPFGRLPLFSARHAITFPAAGHHCLLADTKLYCLMTEAYGCKQLAAGGMGEGAISKNCVGDESKR